MTLGGERLAGGAVAENVYGYSGERFDESLGQYYLRARNYAPQRGRFTQMDDWPGLINQPVTLSKYLYANADPVNHVDPSGQFSLASFGAANNIRSSLRTSSVARFTGVINRTIGTTLKATGRATSKLQLKQLRQCIRKRNRCGLEFNLLMIGYDNPTAAEHIRSAQTPRTVVLTYDPRKTGNRRWYSTGGGRGGCRRPGPLGFDCDEYPFFRTKEGGAYKPSVSLRWIPSRENRSSGAFFWGTRKTDEAKRQICCYHF